MYSVLPILSNIDIKIHVNILQFGRGASMMCLLSTVDHSRCTANAVDFLLTTADVLLILYMYG